MTLPAAPCNDSGGPISLIIERIYWLVWLGVTPTALFSVLLRLRPGVFSPSTFNSSHFHVRGSSPSTLTVESPIGVLQPELPTCFLAAAKRYESSGVSSQDKTTASHSIPSKANILSSVNRYLGTLESIQVQDLCQALFFFMHQALTANIPLNSPV